ncbi:phosphonate metabolism protein/1,5-bisphosphokinase (PRPP-forming) PhnN [Pseudovibrio sp. Ad37]|uniref:phosphonate metabolism protein/1,5-bisphosphokinase (PRPP-forming) PhnN n=1 Tax=Pseudovibrio sp. Ad37 TaxID=989422 RepID=UPI0007AE791A|nr:phosphonate metabolism protein/1,5-bisphosphokinase (PRPP-forming) PhnN [Pseudovibrio sp. Ad37]KZL13582.1 Ribose 1,5-bisphosphate phosphokinase PhnN [Pseudovibrio sp. Ad37]
MTVLDTAQEQAKKLGPGALIMVVGPSGAGKDTLIYGYKELCEGDENIMFARRLITRPTDAGSEPHKAVCREQMSELIDQGRVALSWPAHGLTYALPECVDHHIAKGGIAVANGSRKALADAVCKYEKLLVVHITAPIHVLAQRLSMRGRETAEDIEQRLRRADLSLPELPHLVEIQNTNDPQLGIKQLQQAIATFTR